MAILIGLSFNSNNGLWAHKDHDHRSSQHTEQDHAPAKFLSVGAAWEMTQKSTAAIETAIASQNHEAIHEAEESLSGALSFLQANSPMVTGDKAKRLQSALKQALILSSHVHVAADAKEMTKAAVEFKKLQGALKLVQAQYPTEALKAPSKTTSAQTHLPLGRSLGKLCAFA